MKFREEIGESLTLKFARAAAERRRSGLPIISLGLGEPDFKTPIEIIESTVNILRNSNSGYSDSMGVAGLREKIAEKLLRDNAIKCNAGNILITAGAKQAFQLVCMALLVPGDEIIILNPSYVSFVPQLYIAEPECRIITLDIDKSDFTIPVDEIENLVTPKTKLLILNTPNNPAGYVIPELQIKKIFHLAEEKGFYILSDEIYEKLAFSDHKHFSIGSLESEPHKVFTINGFSKSHAMTGWRLGYACFPNEFRQKLLKLQQHMNTNTCTFIQQAMTQAYNINFKYLEDYNIQLSKRVQMIDGIFSKIDEVKLVLPKAGFFAFLNISGTGIDSNTFCSRLIDESGVATTPGIAFGASWDDHVRISFATPEDSLSKGLDLMCNFIIENNHK